MLLSLSALCLSLASAVSARPAARCSVQDCGLCRVDGQFPEMSDVAPLATLPDSAHWQCRDACSAMDACGVAVTDTAGGACDLYGTPLTPDTQLYQDDGAVMYVRGGCPEICSEARAPLTRPMRGSNSVYGDDDSVYGDADWTGEYGARGEYST